jgi:hypothetical protein
MASAGGDGGVAGQATVLWRRTMSKFTQIHSDASDRQLWGRCLRGYKNALGTGNAYIDPNCEDVGLDGHLNFIMPIEEWELREIWEANRMSTVDPKLAWHIIPQCKCFEIDMLGYKFRRGLFKKDAWLGVLRFFFKTQRTWWW